MLAEAIVAVNRPVTPWLEGDLGYSPAVSTSDLEHLPWASVTAHIAANPGRSSGLTTGGTTLRFVYIPSGCEQFLLAGTKDKALSTLYTSDGLIGESHNGPPWFFLVWLLSSHTRRLLVS